MKQLTYDERRIVREWLDLYLKTPLYPVTQKSVERLKRWLAGESQRTIADSENVSQVSVSQSVHTLALRVIEMAEGVSK